MYPFVWKAYIQEDIKESASMLDKKGKALTDINPTGTVEIRGEIWKAKSLEEKSPIRKKDTVRVVEVQGLTLIIKSCSKSS